ncbi:hypothetical protein DFH09DRAFT_1335088 [Mycena vulgaris]|nr:hypothetical protein DFH09DRAFT_1335088 [Mycena vulgaris]
MGIPLLLNSRLKHPIIGSPTVKSLTMFKTPFFATLGPVAPSNVSSWPRPIEYLHFESMRAIFRPEIFAIRGRGDRKLLFLMRHTPQRIPLAPTLYLPTAATSSATPAVSSAISAGRYSLYRSVASALPMLLALRPPASTRYKLRATTPVGFDVPRDVFACACVSPSPSASAMTRPLTYNYLHRAATACAEQPPLDTRLVRSICSRAALPLSSPIARPVPASLERRARHSCDHQCRSLRKRSQSALTTPSAPLPLPLSRRCTTRPRDYGVLRDCGDVEVVVPARYSICRPALHATPVRIQDTVHTVGRMRSVDVGIPRRPRRFYPPLALLCPPRVGLYAEVLLGPSQQT